jgi:hypothetical protein
MFSKILDVIGKIAPDILANFGGGGFASLIPLIVGIVEKMMPGKGNGKEKKAAVKMIATVVIPLAEKITGKDLFEDKKAISGLEKLIDGSVEFYNSFNAWPDIPTD